MLMHGEVVSGNPVSPSCLQSGETLVSTHPLVSKEVQQMAADLVLHWEELKNAVVTRGKALEDKRDFLEFLQKVEEVEVWIRQKVWMDAGWRKDGCHMFTVCASGGDGQCRRCWEGL